MIEHLNKHKGLYSTLAILAAFSGLLFWYPPDVVVASIGVENSYVVVFLIAALGGLSSLTSGVFYASVATFSSGGAIPWLLGIVGGIGIAIGDSIIFGLLYYGSMDVHVSQKWQNHIDQARLYIDRYPSWVVYAVLFIILGVSPLPNDIVMLALVALGFSYKKIAPILVLAGISITTITAYLGQSISGYIF